MTVTRLTSSICRFLEDTGIGYEKIHIAQTGTIYLDLPNGKKLRIANTRRGYGTPERL